MHIGRGHLVFGDQDRARESLLAHAWTASGFAQRISKVIESAASEKLTRVTGK
jgi:hypothetical protein